MSKETVKYRDLFPRNYNILVYTEEEFEAAVLAEREACAKLMDDMAAQDKLSNYYKVAANASPYP